jgi:ABC-type sugar transport system permease subunit
VIIESDRRKQLLLPYVFLAPVVLFFLIFRVYPIVCSFVLSLFELKTYGEKTFVGFENFVKLFDDAKFVNSTFNTLYFVLASCPPKWVLALLSALLLNRNFVGRKWFRLVFFIPVTISIAIMAVMLKYMYHPDFGLFSYVTAITGVRVNPLLDANLAMPAVVSAVLWMSTPLYIVVYLAALQDIPSMYYEVARLDGATGLQQFWHVTLPLLKSTHLFVVVMSVLAAMREFVPFYVITQGGPMGRTRVLSLYAFESLFKFQKVGYANAISVVIFCLNLVLATVFIRAFEGRAREISEKA